MFSPATKGCVAVFCASRASGVSAINNMAIMSRFIVLGSGFFIVLVLHNKRKKFLKTPAEWQSHVFLFQRLKQRVSMAQKHKNLTNEIPTFSIWLHITY